MSSPSLPPSLPLSPSLHPSRSLSPVAEGVLAGGSDFTTVSRVANDSAAGTFIGKN